MILLGSGGFRTPERVAVWAEQMRSVLGSVRRVLFVPYALADHDGYVRVMIERGLNAGYELDGIHELRRSRGRGPPAEAIFVGGGNTFRLLATLFTGSNCSIRSASACAAGCRTSASAPAPTSPARQFARPTTCRSCSRRAWMPWGSCRSRSTPHYYTGSNYVRHGDEYVEHFGETRDDRLREFHEENATPVVGLWEGGLLRIEGGQVQLVAAAARTFRRGEPPLDVIAGMDLARLVSS